MDSHGWQTREMPSRVKEGKQLKICVVTGTFHPEPGGPSTYLMLVPWPDHGNSPTFSTEFQPGGGRGWSKGPTITTVPFLLPPQTEQSWGSVYVQCLDPAKYTGGGTVTFEKGLR